MLTKRRGVLPAETEASLSDLLRLSIADERAQDERWHLHLSDQAEAASPQVPRQLLSSREGRRERRASTLLYLAAEPYPTLKGVFASLCVPQQSVGPETP